MSILYNKQEFYIIIKERHSGINLHSITANTFIKLGNKEIINNEDFITFTDYKTLEESIILGCTELNTNNQNISNLFKTFFITHKLDFYNIKPKTLVNKLGIYLSEILIGWIFLSNKQGIFINTNDNKILECRVIKFCIPTNTNYTDIDSILILEDNSIISISNKFGTGASASLFTSVIKHL